MAVPRVLWIRHLDDSPTATIGSFTGLRERYQFLGSVVAFPPVPPPDGPAPVRRWQAVLHRFRLSGAYVGTDSWLSPEGVSDGEGLTIARDHLASWLGKLHGPCYQDIHVRPFSTTISGVLFGLVKGKQGLSLVLQPNLLSFHEPWSGYYDESQVAESA